MKELQNMFTQKFNYGIMVGRLVGHEMEILHYCGYPNPPTQDDYKSLLAELKSDEEFGLTEIADELIYTDAPQEIINYFNNSINDSC